MTFRLLFSLFAIALILGLSALPRSPHSHVAWSHELVKQVPWHTGRQSSQTPGQLVVQPF